MQSDRAQKRARSASNAKDHDHAGPTDGVADDQPSMWDTAYAYVHNILEEQPGFAWVPDCCRQMYEDAFARWAKTTYGDQAILETSDDRALAIVIIFFWGVATANIEHSHQPFFGLWFLQYFIDAVQHLSWWETEVEEQLASEVQTFGMVDVLRREDADLELCDIVQKALRYRTRLVCRPKCDLRHCPTYNRLTDFLRFFETLKD